MKGLKEVVKRYSGVPTSDYSRLISDLEIEFGKIKQEVETRDDGKLDVVVHYFTQKGVVPADSGKPVSPSSTQPRKKAGAS